MDIYSRESLTIRVVMKLTSSDVIETLDDGCEKIETWRRDYNSFRPHSSLDNLTPDEFAALLRSGNSLQLAGPVFG